MEPVPLYLAINPWTSFVVALPKILGPIIVKMVEPTAKIMTNTIAMRNGFRYFNKVDSVFDKFFAFSLEALIIPCL